MHGAILPLPKYIFMVCGLTKQWVSSWCTW